jgi:molecular chaperone Hsp33
MSMEDGSRPAQGSPAPDDLVQPFHIEGQPVMGRLVRLGPLVDEVLRRHDYPPEVATLLAEMLALAAGLSSLLKYQGIFTLQVKGDGPVSLMVVDATSGGDLRGYASYDVERLARRAGEAGRPHAPVPRLLGQGYLAFTVDQGSHTERYQGIVELDGATLVDCVQHYFRQSEQLATGIKLAVGPTVSPGVRPGAGRGNVHWRAGIILLQRQPESGSGAPIKRAVIDGEEAEEGWRRSLVLMSSATTAELLDPALAATDLLYRLFHEDGVRVTAPQNFRARCRCSRERVETVLRSLPRDEIESLKVDGEVVVTCEFCSRSYNFADADLEQIYGN